MYPPCRAIIKSKLSSRQAGFYYTFKTFSEIICRIKKKVRKVSEIFSNFSTTKLMNTIHCKVDTDTILTIVVSFEKNQFYLHKYFTKYFKNYIAK